MSGHQNARPFPDNSHLIAPPTPAPRQPQSSISQPMQSSNSLLSFIQPSGSTQQSGGGNSYTVGVGDSLWAIAARVYGSGAQWQRLYQMNTGVVGGNPNLIYPGECLRY